MTSSNVTSAQNPPQHDTWRLLVELVLSGEAGNERLAVELVTGAIQHLNWSQAQLARLSQAVSKATLKGIQRSPPGSSDTWLLLRVLIPGEVWTKQMADSAGAEQTHPAPLRGWGFFLIERAVPTPGAVGGQLIELFLYLEGGIPEGRSATLNRRRSDLDHPGE